MVEAQPIPPPRQSLVLGWWPKTTKAERHARHVVASLVWLYSTCQLVVFDVDSFLIERLPASVAWIVEFKLFVLLCVIAVLFLTISTKRMIAWSLYIAFYPLTRFVWLFAIACYLVVKARSWPVLFTAFNLVLSAFSSAKFTFVVFVFSATSFIIASTSHVAGSLWFAALMSVLLVVAVVAKRFISIFRPSRLLNAYAKIIALLVRMPQHVLANDQSIKLIAPEKMTPEQLKKWASNLQTAIMLDEMCNFLILKLQKYRRSVVPVAFYLANFVILVAVVMFLFATANMALFKINSSWFTVSDGHGFFEFFYYSFSTIFLQRIPEVVPASTPARLMWMMEIALAFILTGMLVALFFAVKKNQDDSGTIEAVDALRTQSQVIQKFVQSEYSLSIQQAADELERYQKGISAFIRFMRNAAGPASKLLDGEPNGQ